MSLRINNVRMTDSGGSSFVRPEKDLQEITKPSALKPKPSVQTVRTVNPPAAAQTGGAGAAAKTPTFESLVADMMTRYMPETVSYNPPDEETVRTMLIGWLRPAYEQAIANRREQTSRYNAELDADAWARGMGSSTYVTDVKDRAFAQEARDVNALESDYAATLASHLYDAMKSGQEQKLSVDQFNAEQQNRAKERAIEAANTMYRAYVSAASSSSGSGKSGAAESKQTASTASGSTTQAKASNAISLKDAANLIARLSPQNREALYAGKGAYAQAYREILDSIGMGQFRKLMMQYPA